MFLSINKHLIDSVKGILGRLTVDLMFCGKRELYQITGASVTNCHKLDGAKQQKWTLSRFSRPQI